MGGFLTPSKVFLKMVKMGRLEDFIVSCLKIIPGSEGKSRAIEYWLADF